MANVIEILPGIEGDEMVYVQGLIQNMEENQARQFANAYTSRRKDSTNLLIFALLGFLGIAGIQRFIVGNAGMGVLYLVTGGICGIGTIMDLINAKKLAFEYNQKCAQQIMVMVKGSN
jgi:TM2 domain-containing membrane protein YozV